LLALVGEQLRNPRTGAATKSRRANLVAGAMTRDRLAADGLPTRTVRAGKPGRPPT